MKRTREKTEQQDEEEVRSQLFDSEVKNLRRKKLSGESECLGIAFFCRSPLPCVPVETELYVSPPMSLLKTLSLDVLLLKVFLKLS